MFKHFLVLLLAVAGFTAGSAAPAFAKETKRKPRLVQVVYPVADLVVPIDMDIKESGNKPQETVESVLMDVIRRGVAPASWEENGGPANIDYFPLGMSLVVRQTPAAQRQIQQMLEAMRRPQDLQVVSEICILEVSAATVERCGEDAALSHLLSNGEAALLDAQLRRLMEAAQGDRRTNLIQAPRVTCFNGQRARVCVQETVAHIERVGVEEECGRVVIRTKKETVTPGVAFSVWPVVAADRRSVTLNVDAQLTRLSGAATLTPQGQAVIRAAKVESLPVTLVSLNADGNCVETPLPIAVQRPAISTLHLNRTLRIPDGKTAVLHLGKQMIEERTEHGPPILRDIPYVGRLFRNIGYGLETQHVLVLVTPRIVVQEEEEAISAAR